MSDTLHEVEISIEEAKEKIECLDALNRLHGNKDFELVINTGYFKNKAAEIVLAKADPEMQNEDKQKSCIKTIDAIGELRQYFAVITQLGQMARRDLAEHEQTREEVLDEDAGIAHVG